MSELMRLRLLIAGIRVYDRYGARGFQMRGPSRQQAITTTMANFMMRSRMLQKYDGPAATA